MSHPLLLECKIGLDGVDVGYGVSAHGLKYMYEGDIQHGKAHGVGIRTSEAGTSTFGHFQNGVWGGGDIVRKTSWGEYFFRPWQGHKFKDFVRYNAKNERHAAVMKKAKEKANAARLLVQQKLGLTIEGGSQNILKYVSSDGSGHDVGIGLSELNSPYTYAGNVRNFKAHGVGVKTYPSGYVLYGHFHDGLCRGGDAILQFPTGVMYFHEWKNGTYYQKNYSEKITRHNNVMRAAQEQAVIARQKFINKVLNDVFEAT
eukprot:m.348272 g.348272  ORF g.348272 m.348272 type:complete len:258 (+) comp36311_c0_seq1:223-996(+)